LEYKFYEDADKISEAWIATRIRRVGLSRKNVMQEEMGYLDGGLETLVRALVEKIESGGGRFSQQGRTKKGLQGGIASAPGVFPLAHASTGQCTPIISFLYNPCEPGCTRPYLFNGFASRSKISSS
jgi:hypothetical protein